MNRFDQYYDAVRNIEEHIRLDFFGPLEEEELLIGETPLSRYDTGILWAQETSAMKSEFEEKLVNINEIFEDELQEMNETASKINSYMPSAMAITVVIGEKMAVSAELSYGSYTYEGDRTGGWGNYRRAPHTINVPPQIIPNRITTICLSQDDQCEIRAHVRCIYPDGSRLMTISVVNRRCTQKSVSEQNSAAMFQCRLILRTEQAFLPLYQQGKTARNDESLMNEMLYRHVKNYAYGHGCSVYYEEEQPVVQQIESAFLPQIRLRQMIPATFEQDNFLHMIYWTEEKRSAGCDALEQFVQMYLRWKDQLEKTDLEAVYDHPREQTLQNIEICSERMMEGIACLRGDDTAWRSFLLMAVMHWNSLYRCI